MNLKIPRTYYNLKPENPIKKVQKAKKKSK